MEDADSISFWYKIAAFAQYNIPKIKKLKELCLAR